MSDQIRELLSSVALCAEAVRSKRVSAKRLVAQCLADIADKNAAINAFVFLDADGALRRAAEIDRMIAAGDDPGPLAGVPFGVKDLEDCEGMPTTKGSVFFKDSGPAAHDSTHVTRLKRHGAIAIGKVAAAEFGIDGVTHTKAWGTTRNPWNLNLTPGGSSGGSAASVASRMVPFSTTSDGGGSTRVPAAFTGLVGFKPGMGRIPRPNGFSDVNCLGCHSTDVAGTLKYLDAVVGPDDHDRMTLPRPSWRFESEVAKTSPKGARAIWSGDLGFAPVQAEVGIIAGAAARRLIEIAGLRRVDRQVRLTNVYTDWARLAGNRMKQRLELDGFLPEREDELSPGPRDVLTKYANCDARELAQSIDRVMRLEQEVAAVFGDTEFLLTPTAACEPYPAKGPMVTEIEGQDASETNGEPYTIFANVCWNPSISVPAGLTMSGVPVGLMITGRRHDDLGVLRLAQIFEEHCPWQLHPGGY